MIEEFPGHPGDREAWRSVGHWEWKRPLEEASGTDGTRSESQRTQGKGDGRVSTGGKQKKENRPINHINFLSDASNKSHNVIFANVSRSLIAKRITIHNLETTLLSPFLCPSLCLTPTAERMKTTWKDWRSSIDLFRASAYLSTPPSSVTYFLCYPCQSFSAFPHTSSSSSQSLAPFISSCAHLPRTLQNWATSFNAPNLFKDDVTESKHIFLC